MFGRFRTFFSKDRKFRESLKNVLGFYPGNISLYRKAFTHSSAAPEIKDGVKDSYERLEFLGDAVLSTIIADYLFKKFPFKDEGFLTKMRSKIVSRNQLNKLSLRFGLQKFIDADFGFSRNSHSVHGDVFEALIGAIYLDKGYAFVNRFIQETIIREHLDMEEIEQTETDFKSKFIEWAQKEKKAFAFIVVEEVMSGSEKHYVVEARLDQQPMGRGQSISKKKAEQQAAEQAVLLLGKA
ncbi:MAG TPA: ribonuclease III [Bacteroidia bacterium]|nr:ribonuclease III [Bacteroidia bacterium]